MMQEVASWRRSWPRLLAWLVPHLWEPALIVVGGVGCTALVFAGAWLGGTWSRFLIWAGWLGFVSGLLFLGWRTAIALGRRQWWGGVIRLLALPLCLLAGLFSLFLAEMAGRWAGRSAHLLLGTSPLTKSAVLHWQLVGREAAARVVDSRRAAADPEAAWALASLQFLLLPEEKKEVAFVFAVRGGEFSTLTLCLTPAGAGGWSVQGVSASGDMQAVHMAEPQLRQFLSELLSEAHAPPWPITEAQTRFFTEAAAELAQGFREAAPLSSAGLTWQWLQIAVSDDRGPSSQAPVCLVFRATESDSADSPDSVWAWTYWTWIGGKLHLVDSNASITRGTHSSGGLNDHARLRSFLLDWLKDPPGDHFARVRETGDWALCPAELANGWQVIYRQKLAHPFLAEYHMAVEFVSPTGKKHHFALPMNTGGRTVLNVFQGRTGTGKEALLLSSRHFAAAWELPEGRWIEEETVLDPQFLGAFLQVTTPLRWVAVDDPDAADLFQQAGERGYPFVGRPTPSLFEP